MPVHYLQKGRKTHKNPGIKYQPQMKKKFKKVLNLDCV